MQRYNDSQVELWAREYKKCMNFNTVGKKFGVNHKTVKARLRNKKEQLNLLL